MFPSCGEAWNEMDVGKPDTGACRYANTAAPNRNKPKTRKGGGKTGDRREGNTTTKTTANALTTTATPAADGKHATSRDATAGTTGATGATATEREPC